jgi:hypothetical protein
MHTDIFASEVGAEDEEWETSQDYIVTWSISLSATNGVDAARQALGIMRDPYVEANRFRVWPTADPLGSLAITLTREESE